MVKTFDELTCYKIFASTESENFMLPAINDGLLQQTTDTQPTVVSIKGSLLLLSLYLVMKYTCRDIFSSKMVFFFSKHRFQKKPEVACKRGLLAFAVNSKQHGERARRARAS